MRHEGHKDGVSNMPQAPSFYEGRSFVQGLIWWFVMGRIGQNLRERYQVTEELPSKLLMLVRKLDDRDWLFPSSAWYKDVDLFGG
jgi:hypothetical protein